MHLRVAAVVGITFGSAAVYAQPPATQPPILLTADEAVSRGLAASHRLTEATARHDTAEAVVGERRAALLPQVAAVAGYTRTNHVDPFGILLPNEQFRVIYPDIPDNYRTRLDLQYPIYNGGRLDALTAAARKESAATGDDVERICQCMMQ